MSGSKTNVADEVEKFKSSDEDLTKESTILLSKDGYEVAFEDLHTKTPRPFRFVPLRMGGNGRTHVATDASAALVEEVGSLPVLQNMTERFYEKAFKDATLDKFIRSRSDPHGKRFAAFIHQKLGGPGRVWDADRASRSQKPVTLAHGQRVVVHDRTSAHVAAWHSPKRADKDVGRRFQLDECRVWMRLHFWAMREAGVLELSPSFADYYVRFIGHFVRVYESTAPTFARESLRWSKKQENIDTYMKNECIMDDVLGLTFEEAFEQLPGLEANDMHWPYILEEHQKENDYW
eukprot:CAMPEP_0113545988 /NCGR_PEP_ID=MMETSP0015_2-20120614/11563_1 /TAXON_ID=2838 /ORGANISM="Odontella" /LENGTH=290 /DNA_ID=CAMNT_0000446407 /DNA_START=187 /DNA_END=1056 /DNA_ORIENTATION=+ /assembly_acc=CAM_ASM_000160